MTRGSQIRGHLVALAGDPFVGAATVLLCLAGLSAVAAPPLSGAVVVWWRLPVLVVAAWAARSGLDRVVDQGERWFWTGIAAANVCWAIAPLVGLLTSANVDATVVHVASDGVYLASYLPLLMAIEWRPHEPGPDPLGVADRWIHVLSIACVASGWFAYFVVVPAVIDRPFYGSLIPAHLLFVILDVTLIGLYLFVGRRCGVPRWRAQYWLVGLAGVALGATHVAGLLTDMTRAAVGAHVENWLWLWPPTLSIVASRIRHQRFEDPKAASPNAQHTSLGERARSGAVVVAGAMLFPLVHIWIQPLFPASALLRYAQGIVVLVMLGVLGALAIVTFRLLGQRHRAQATAHEHLQMTVREIHRLDAVGRLAGGISHDFNNMLTGIVGYNEMALQGLPDDDPNRPALQQIAQIAGRASTLTQQLLALSRRQVLNPERVNLNAVIEQLVPMLSRVIGEDVRLSTRLESGVSDVMADRSQLHGIILSLAANARDAMPNGGALTITTTAERPDAAEGAPVPHQDHDTHVELTVHDSGPDIPATAQAHVFEPFSQPASRGRASGLSLAAIQGTVVQSGGSIAVRSEPGQGTAFVIRLPRADHRRSMVTTPR